jgi:hypothetical protein
MKNENSDNGHGLQIRASEENEKIQLFRYSVIQSFVIRN